MTDTEIQAFAEKLRYCGGNLTYNDQGAWISLSPKLFDKVRRDLGWREPVRRTNGMNMQEVNAFTALIDTLASE